MFNLCSATLGAGALSLPLAFKQSGLVLGPVLLAVGALATVFSIRLLIECRQATGLRSYEDLSVGLFGKKMGLFVELNIFLFCLGCAVAYIIAIGNIFQPVIDITPWLKPTYNGGVPTYRYATAAFWLVVMFPLSLSEKVNTLRFTSFFGVLAICYLVVATVTNSVRDAVDRGIANTWGAPDRVLVAPTFSDVIQSAPIIMFAFTCQVNVFSIYDELERASVRRMARVTNYGILLCFAVYGLMGTMGYLNFGAATQGNVLINYCIAQTRSGVEIAAFVCMALTITMAFPLLVFPCRYTLDVMLFAKREPSRLRSGLLTFGISGTALVLGLFVRKINVVFQLLGGTTSAFVCFVLPAMFAVKLGMAKPGSNPAWKRAAIWSLLVGGAIIGTLSTITTVYYMVKPQPGGPDPCAHHHAHPHHHDGL